MLISHRPISVFLILLPLLNGCAIGNGVAHVAKLIGHSQSNQSSDNAAPTPQPASAPAETAPEAPPPPEAAPVDKIKVEELPPPR